jgi:hypothetical protein
MRSRPTALTLLALAPLILLPPTLHGQEGFPLDGTWRGEWGNETEGPHLVVIVMKWDGESVNGLLNPGPNSIGFTGAVLEPSDWTVRIEVSADSDDPIVIEGRLTDIGSYNRKIEGTWRQGGTHYPLSIARE